MPRNFLRSSLQDASWNIILQVSFRVVTFGLNAYVVRRVSQDAIGVMYVRLLLLESTILFLSRDAFRKACLSRTVEHHWPKVINLVWLTVPLSIFLSAIFGYIWLYVLTPPSPSVTQHYTFGVAAILITCIMEMCCEQLYLVSQAFLFLKLRVFVDVFSIMTRTITFVLLLTPENAVFAFSIAQILSITVYVSIFYGYFIYYFRQKRKVETQSRHGRRDSVVEFPFHSISDFGPKYLKNQEQIDYKLLVLVRNFLKQGVMMQVLTEGERYVMTLLNVLSFAEQGVFDVVNNLGSLAARFLFRPIESSAFFYFSQLIDRNVDISKQDKKSMHEAAKVLKYLLCGVSTLGLLVLCFGQSYSQFVLFLYGGRTLATGLGPKLLRTHCLAILLMAVNGSTEGYLLSTINAEDLNKHNKLMVLFSATFLFVAWLLSYTFGSVGFILANCCNMSLRILNSVRFIRRRYQNTNFTPLSGLLPKKYFLLVLAISTVITQLSEVYLFPDSLVLHFLVGAVCFCGTVVTWYFQEQELFKFCTQNW